MRRRFVDVGEAHPLHCIEVIEVAPEFLEAMTQPPVTIHVVDDDPSFRRAMGRMLQATGYQVALYESGDKLLEKTLDNGPGCC